MRPGRSQVPADSESSQRRVVGWRYGRPRVPDALFWLVAGVSPPVRFVCERAWLCTPVAVTVAVTREQTCRCVDVTSTTPIAGSLAAGAPGHRILRHFNTRCDATRYGCWCVAAPGRARGHRPAGRDLRASAAAIRYPPSR